MSSWPFDQPRDCAVISLKAIMTEGAPILFVSHDADDHGWQFLGLEPVDPKAAVVVALSEVVALDSTLLEIAGLPPGWCAWRDSPSAPWQRAEASSLEDNQ